MKGSGAGIGAAALLAGLLLVFGVTLLAGAVLKETPIFWRNAGGYPEALRALVLNGFYPGLIFYFICLLTASFFGWCWLRAGSLGGGLLLLGCAANWLILAVISTIVVWNNVENLLQGRPLHFHGP